MLLECFRCLACLTSQELSVSFVSTLYKPTLDRFFVVVYMPETLKQKTLIYRF